jgi:hypothetical protein
MSKQSPHPEQGCRLAVRVAVFWRRQIDVRRNVGVGIDGVFGKERVLR